LQKVGNVKTITILSSRNGCIDGLFELPLHKMKGRKSDLRGV